MTKHVLDVGNCAPDHAAITRLISSQFQAEVDQTHLLDDTLEALRNQQYDLVLVNRKLDQDYSDGLEIIKAIKADDQLKSVPVMLVTNFTEHQELAVAEGAVYGFGKLEFDEPQTHEKIATFL